MRGLSKDTSGVSPVMGAVMMVALVVVLSSIVVLWVQNFDERAETAPAFTIIQDEFSDRWQIVKVDDGVVPSDYQILSSHEVRYAFNGEAGMSDPAAGPVRQIFQGPDLISGHYIDFCAVGGAEDVEIQVTHPRANSVVLLHEFGSLAAC